MRAVIRETQVDGESAQEYQADAIRSLDGRLLKATRIGLVDVVHYGATRTT